MKYLFFLFGTLGCAFSAFAQGDSTKVFIYGCTDSLALNYSSLATIDDGSCVYNWGDSTKLVYGCTDSLALNYNPLATIDDSSCVYDVGVKDEFKTSSLTVYPIPFSNAIHLMFEAIPTEKMSILIYDVSGRLVYAKERTFTSGRIERIDATHLRKGMYVLQVNGTSFHLSRQLIKE